MPAGVWTAYKPASFATIPMWIRMETDLRHGARIWKCRKFLQTHRKIGTADVRTEVTKDQEAFAQFYRQTYLPYIAVRFEDTARLESVSVAKQIF